MEPPCTPVRPYAMLQQVDPSRSSSKVTPAPPAGEEQRRRVSWAHVAQGLALVGLVLAAGGFALGSRNDTGKHHRDGLASMGTTSAVLVTPGLRSTMRRSRASILQQNGVKGGGFMEGPSLWCFALMLPWGYEPALLTAQRNAGIGIFACNAYDVLSNSTFVVHDNNNSNTLLKKATPWEIEGSKQREKKNAKEGPLVTHSIGGDLFVRFGGKWHTAMNTDIFIRVWDLVIKLGTFREHAWTVKADPDSVFFPARLRQMVVDEPSGPIYLNNCKFGLHGPVEVMSKEALQLYHEKSGHCEDIRDAGMDMSKDQSDADHAYGEDEYIHRCFDKIGVGRVDELGLLLSETACNQKTVPCDEGKVSFHPFKTMQEYFDCWGLGGISTAAWDGAIAAAPMPRVASDTDVLVN